MSVGVRVHVYKYMYVCMCICSRSFHWSNVQIFYFETQYASNHALRQSFHARPSSYLGSSYFGCVKVTMDVVDEWSSPIHILRIECVWLVAMHEHGCSTGNALTINYAQIHIHVTVAYAIPDWHAALSKYKKNTIEATKWSFTFSTSAPGSWCWSLRSCVCNLQTPFSQTKPTRYHTPWMFCAEVSMLKSGLPLRFPATQEVTISRQWQRNK